MTALSFAVPYNRVSALYEPRRDLVLDMNDSLSLAVTVTESDAPGASLIDLVTGPTFPGFTLQVWPDGRWTPWDYGAQAWPVAVRRVLYETTGVISGIYPGTVDFTVPTSALAAWPARCLFAIRMDHNTTLSETLIRGALNVRGAVSLGAAA